MDVNLWSHKVEAVEGGERIGLTTKEGKEVAHLAFSSYFYKFVPKEVQALQMTVEAFLRDLLAGGPLPLPHPMGKTFGEGPLNFLMAAPKELQGLLALLMLPLPRDVTSEEHALLLATAKRLQGTYEDRKTSGGTPTFPYLFPLSEHLKSLEPFRGLYNASDYLLFASQEETEAVLSSLAPLQELLGSMNLTALRRAAPWHLPAFRQEMAGLSPETQYTALVTLLVAGVGDNYHEHTLESFRRLLRLITDPSLQGVMRESFLQEVDEEVMTRDLSWRLKQTCTPGLLEVFQKVVALHKEDEEKHSRYESHQAMTSLLHLAPVPIYWSYLLPHLEETFSKQELTIFLLELAQVKETLTFQEWENLLQGLKSEGPLPATWWGAVL